MESLSVLTMKNNYKPAETMRQELQDSFAAKIKEQTGANIEVTFTDSHSFSLVADSAADLNGARLLISELNATLEGSDECEEMFAEYYRF